MSKQKSCKSFINNRFTLVELLVVISVITILVSMLLPALNKARDKAKQIVCVGNLKQTGQATFMYANDYKDWTPIIYESTAKLAPNENRSWMAKLYNNRYVSEPKAGKSTIFLCPSQEPTVWYDLPEYRYHEFAYGMTLYGRVTWTQNQAWLLRSIIVNNFGHKISGGSPSKFILFADSTYYDPAGNSGNLKQRYYIYFSNESSKIRLIHNKTANFFVGDGHVGTLNRDGLFSQYDWINTMY
jgi:type II secretory pathway pseudopilin PulG